MKQQTIDLTASDGHTLSGFVCTPEKPRGAVVVVQEIFGVNDHIQSVTAGFARAGYTALAPALFDRQERGVQLGYDTDGMARAGALYGKINVPNAVLDVAAAVKALQPSGKVAVVGYCFGGLLAWLAAGQVSGVAAAVGYYGGGITDNLDVAPQAPVQLHFGARDEHVPTAPIANLRARYPQVEVFLYEAGHGFNCDQRPSYNAEAASTAGERTLQFLRQHVG